MGSSGMGMDDERHARGTASAEDGERADTGRLEAFSDGVFAVAITLLVLDLRVPDPSHLPDGNLLIALVRQWPAYFSYGLSFAFILVMWINHHRMFRLIRRCDHMLLLLNGLLLLLIALVPFATALLADYIAKPDPVRQQVAAVVYNGLYVVIALAFNALWRYAAHGLRLLAPDAHPAQVNAITRSYVWGPVLYGLALALAFISVPASVLLNVALALYWALPPLRRVRARPA